MVDEEQLARFLQEVAPVMEQERRVRGKGVGWLLLHHQESTNAFPEAIEKLQVSQDEKQGAVDKCKDFCVLMAMQEASGIQTCVGACRSFSWLGAP